jgi:acetolactate synthase-1/2/3 large subunit
MAKMTGSRHIAEALRGYGVSRVFFVPAVRCQALAEMEDSDARASGKPGICMAQNIGGSNIAARLRDAAMAGSPVVALTGGPSPAARCRNPWTAGAARSH